MHTVRPLAERAAIALALILTALLPFAAAAGSDGDPWPYLPVDDIGAVDWRAEHPEWDGRGVVLAILDTGVDGFAPGLLTTTTGGRKILDTRDFTSEGEYETVEAESEEGVYVHPDGHRLEGAGDLPVPPDPDDVLRPAYMGLIEETRFVNADDVSDVNDDGDTGDVFGFLVYAADRAAVETALGVGAGLEMLAALNETAAAAVARERASERVWLVVVDTDGDGSLSDEKILRDYHVAWDHFGLGSPNDEDSRTLMAWSLNVSDDKDWLGRFAAPSVEFHHDSGAHGSHCAGIAAGYEVGGQPGLNGVAPGAWVISCKLGDNRLSGGATRT